MAMDRDLEFDDNVIPENAASLESENFGSHDVGNEILDASGLDQSGRAYDQGYDRISLSNAVNTSEDEMLHTDNNLALELTDKTIL